MVEKLILYGFSLYGNGRLKRFVNCCYGIFQQLYFIILYTSYTTIKLQKRNVNFRKSYRQIFM
ncbi:hypothetical protein C4X99_17670 [Leptospira interrogans serovar Geyaweera]|nr:hypothetical protein C5473_05135 [Leptospira interrogans serovar Weerasinghe]KAA1291916.1 hypothetical protein C4X99_17670 [Leptospira interrogans serovar Geyaweera]